MCSDSPWNRATSHLAEWSSMVTKKKLNFEAKTLAFQKAVSMEQFERIMTFADHYAWIESLKINIKCQSFTFLEQGKSIFKWKHQNESLLSHFVGIKIIKIKWILFPYKLLSYYIKGMCHHKSSLIWENNHRKIIVNRGSAEGCVV